MLPCVDEVSKNLLLFLIMDKKKHNKDSMFLLHTPVAVQMYMTYYKWTDANSCIKNCKTVHLLHFNQ